MMISSKGRYALRVMIDLAQHRDEGYVSVKTICDRQEVSMKYMESIIAMLNKAGFVESLRGKVGGYRLTRENAAYSVGEIVALAEGSLAPIPCLENGAAECERAGQCMTLPIWKNLDKIIYNYLNSVTLQDVLDQNFEEK